MDVFEDLYPFFGFYVGKIKIYDMDTGDVLFEGDNPDDIPMDFDNCDLGLITVQGDCLFIEIEYSFHEIED